MGQIPVANVSTVDYEDDGVARGVVALPELSQRVLSADVPDFKVNVWEGDGGHILADRGDGFEFGVGVGGEVEGFDLFVEGGFAGVVEAEEENRVFYPVVR